MIPRLLVAQMTISLSLVNFALGADPMKQPCKELMDALPTMERTCLSNTSTGYSASFKGAINLFLRRSAEGSGSVSSEEVHGARRDLDAELQKPENDSIRSCLGDYQKRLLDCLERAMLANQRVEEKTFAKKGAYVAVGCNDSQRGSVEVALPEGAFEIQHSCAWVDTDNLKSQPCESGVAGTTVRASGTIIGLDRTWLGDCPGGGHANLQLTGSYKLRATP